jgi:hypothetical protein
MSDDEMKQARKNLHHAIADITCALEEAGDLLAQKHGYSGLSGLEAARYHLMQKHHWLPRDLNSMSNEDLHFALSQELSALRTR